MQAKTPLIKLYRLVLFCLATLIFAVFATVNAQEIPQDTIDSKQNSEAEITTQAAPESEKAKKLFPRKTGFIMDQAKILSESTIKKTTLQLEKLAKTFDTEFVILTIEGLGSELKIEEYTYNIGNYWKIGQAEYSKGILFVIAPDSGEVRFETGFGLQEPISSFALFGIYKEIVLPLLQQGDFDQAVTKAVETISEAIKDENLANIYAGNKTELPKQQIIIISIIFAFLTVLSGSFFGRYDWHAGSISGAVLGLILSVLNYSLIWLIPVYFLLGFITDRLAKRKTNTPTPILMEDLGL